MSIFILIFMNVIAIGSEHDPVPLSSIVIVKDMKAGKYVSETFVFDYTKHCINSFVAIKTSRKIVEKEFKL